MFTSIGFLIKEHIDNYRLLIKLAFINMGKQTIRTSLGVGWLYFHDFTYILVFIAFRILMSGNGLVNGMSSIIYLVTGLIPWFFMNDVLTQGANSIKNSKAFIQSIKFPITVIPTIEVFAIFLKRLFTFFLAILVSLVFDYIKYFNFILFIYYMFSMLVLMLAINFTLSAFVAISADFFQMYMAVLRVLMFSMPILWSFENIQNIVIQVVLRVNPMVYIIQGFRDAFVFGKLQNGGYTLYFWTCVIMLFGIGSFVQYKLRKFYADFI